jgi:hypothetical protein
MYSDATQIALKREAFKGPRINVIRASDFR